MDPSSSDSEIAERRVRVDVAPSEERGIHRLTFVERPGVCGGGRRYVLVTKSGEFAERDSEDFHWVATFEAYDPCAPTVVCVEFETGMWCFRVDFACVSYGVLPPGAAEPKLPDWAAEYESVTFSLRPGGAGEENGLIFEPERERLPAHVQAGYQRFYDVFNQVDGHEVSWQDTQHMGPATGLTYGESHFMPTYELLRCLDVKPGEVLVDLGSGTGRVVLCAALAFPALGACVGIELLPKLHSAAESAYAQIVAEEPAIAIAPVTLLKGDLLEGTWPETATVVVAMSLCFPSEMLEALERRCSELPLGARVVTMHETFGAEAGLRPLAVRSETPQHGMRLEMSFGRAPLFVYERVVSKDGKTAPPRAWPSSPSACGWLDTLD